MAEAITTASRLQIGKEVTRGTAVAATRRLVAAEMSFKRLQTQRHFDDLIGGTLARTFRAPIIHREGMEAEIKLPLDFEQILWPLLSGVKGGVTPTTPDAVNAPNLRQWAFTPGMATDPAPDTYTLEFVESDFTNNAELESPYTFTRTLEIEGGWDGIGDMSIGVMGRKVAESTMTAGIALPTVGHASGLRWGLFVDGTWVNLGVTAVTGQLVRFAWKLEEFIKARYYQDNRADLDFSNYVYGKRTVDLELEVTHNPAAGGLVQLEETAKNAGTGRAIRLRLTGPASGTLNKWITLDGFFYHADDSMEERGRDDDGNLVVTLRLQSAREATQDQDFEITVRNELTAFP